MGNSSAKSKKTPTVEVTASPRTLHELIASRAKQHVNKVAQVSQVGHAMRAQSVLVVIL